MRNLIILSFFIICINHKLPGQCNNIINTYLHLPVGPANTHSWSPFDSNCGCPGNTNCRLVVISLLDISQTPPMIGNCSGFVLDSDTPMEDNFDVFDPISCSEYSSVSPTLPDRYLIPTSSIPPGGSISLYICAGDVGGSGNSNFSVHPSDLCFPFVQSCPVQSVDPQLTVQTGDAYIEEACRGLVLKSPFGFCYRITVDDAGNVQTQYVTCP